MAGRILDDQIRCSFCNKTQDQVRKLIAGPNGVYICDECVEICADIIDEEYEEEPAEDQPEKKKRRCAWHILRTIRNPAAAV